MMHWQPGSVVPVNDVGPIVERCKRIHQVERDLLVGSNLGLHVVVMPFEALRFNQFVIIHANGTDAANGCLKNTNAVRSVGIA